MKPELMLPRGSTPSGRRAAGWLLIDRWIARSLSIGTLIFAAHLYSPRELAPAAVAQLVALLSGLLGEQFVHAAIVRESQPDRRFLASAFALSLCWWTVIAFIVATAAFVFGNALAHNGRILLLLVALSLPFNGLLSVPQGLLERSLRFDALAIRNVLVNLVASLTAVILVLLGKPSEGLVAQQVIAAAAMGIATMAYVRWTPASWGSRVDLRRLLRFGGRLQLSHILGASAGFAQRGAVLVVLGPTALATFTLAQRAALLADEASSGISERLSLPILTRYSGDDLDREFVRLSALCWRVFAPLMIALGSAAPLVTHYLLGPAWRTSATAIALFLFGSSLLGGIQFDRAYLVRRDRLDVVTRWSIAALLLDLCVIAISVPFGVVALAGGWLARCLVALPLRERMLMRAGLRLPTRTGRRTLATSLALVGPVTGAMLSGRVDNGVLAAIGFAAALVLFLGSSRCGLGGAD